MGFNGLFGLRGWDATLDLERPTRCFNGLFGLRGWDSSPETRFTIMRLMPTSGNPRKLFRKFVLEPLILGLLFL